MESHTARAKGRNGRKGGRRMNRGGRRLRAQLRHLIPLAKHSTKVIDVSPYQFLRVFFKDIFYSFLLTEDSSQPNFGLEVSMKRQFSIFFQFSQEPHVIFQLHPIIFPIL